MKSIQIFVKVCVALSFAVIALPTQAQKLNNIQEGSLWAPAGIKVDAKLADWGNLQAFNKTIGLNYTIANDQKNLYMVIKADDPSIANKIVAGGIDLTINTAGKKSAKEAYVVSFPLVNPANLRNQMSQFRRPQAGGGMQTTMPDSAAIAQMRKQAVTNFKEIKLIGFKDIADSVISIYNEYGIKAAADYDDKGALICELAVPLKYMSLAGGDKPFAYNIRLNGLNINAMMASMGINVEAMAAASAAAGGAPVTAGGGGRNVVIMGGPGGGGGGGGGFPGGGFTGGGPGGPGGGFGGGQVMRMRGGGMGDMQNMTAPTDFWATYIPAKK